MSEFIKNMSKMLGRPFEPRKNDKVIRPVGAGHDVIPRHIRENVLGRNPDSALRAYDDFIRPSSTFSAEDRARYTPEAIKARGGVGIDDAVKYFDGGVRGGGKGWDKFSRAEKMKRIHELDNKKIQVDKVLSLADSGYGSVAAAMNEMDKAAKVSRARGSDMRMLPSAGDELIEVRNNRFGGNSYSSKSIKDGIDHHINYDSKQLAAAAKPDLIMGYQGGEITSGGEALGHELGHAFSMYKYDDKNYDFGKTGWSIDEDQSGHSYPESSPVEYAPALMALTRHEYKNTGKRITSEKDFNAKVDGFLAMSPEERKKFRGGLPVEVSRFYGYVDYLNSDKAKGEDIHIQRRINGKGSFEKVKGKDRFKRFKKEAGRMIPELTGNKSKQSFGIDKMGVTGRA
jgi:hypothetical protein